MIRLSFGACAALVLCSVTAMSAQDLGTDPNEPADAPKAGTELFIVGDGDDPWPETTQPRKVRKKVRRTGSDQNPDEPPIDEYAAYLQSLTYTKSRTPLRQPPGMLVVDYAQMAEANQNDDFTAQPPSQRIGEIAPNAVAGPAPENPASNETPPPDPENLNSYGYSFGGTSVNDAEAPWQAQIYYPNIADEWRAQLQARVPLWSLQHFCGGALIAENWVVTAAHCIDDKMRKNGYRVRLGQEDVSRIGGWNYKIERVVVHPKYVSRVGGDLNDIALIKIKNDTGHAAPLWRQVHPIPLYRGAAPTPSTPITVFGWGRTSNAGWSAHSFLMKVGLNVMSDADCTPFAEQLKWSLDGSVICAKSPPKTARKTCKGDSGGPVVDGATRKLVAVVSGGGTRCAADSIPSIYTRIGAYLTWIETVTGRAAR